MNPSEHDEKLSALYRAHLADGQPSATSDALVLRMAREGVRASGAGGRANVAKAGGWRAWLSKPWFGPGLAFATIASLSVVVVSLMPKEEMSTEREIASSAAPVNAAKKSAAASDAAQPAAAPGAAMVAQPVRVPEVAATAPAASVASAPAASGAAASAPTASATMPAPAAPAPMASVALSPSPSAPASTAGPSRPAAARPSAAASQRMSAGDVPSDLRRSAAPEATPKAKTMMATESAPERGERNPPAVVAAPAFVPAPQSPPPSGKVTGQRADAAPASASPLKDERANPFPAQAPAAPLPGPTPAADTGRYEKPSLLTEPTESRLQNQAVAEVPDSAPTYPNEARPSIPLPYTYTMPRKSRDASAGTGAAASPSAAASAAASASPSAAASAAASAGQLSRAATAQSLGAVRKEDVAERRLEKANVAPPSLAAAAPARDPAEWVKAIQKLRTEGKMEQVLKELAEFRKVHPQYALPEELKNLK